MFAWPGDCKLTQTPGERLRTGTNLSERDARHLSDFEAVTMLRRLTFLSWAQGSVYVNAREITSSVRWFHTLTFYASM